MRSLALLFLFTAADARATSCRYRDCTCEPATFTALGVVGPDGHPVIDEARWQDGGVASIDGGLFLQEPVDGFELRPGVRLLMGGTPRFRDSGAFIGFGLRAFPIDDGGSTITCRGTFPEATWRQALYAGTCDELAPPPPCVVRPACSLAGGDVMLGVAALVFARLVASRR